MTPHNGRERSPREDAHLSLISHKFTSTEKLLRPSHLRCIYIYRADDDEDPNFPGRDIIWQKTSLSTWFLLWQQRSLYLDDVSLEYSPVWHVTWQDRRSTIRVRVFFASRKRNLVQQNVSLWAEYLSNEVCKSPVRGFTAHKLSLKYKWLDLGASYERNIIAFFDLVCPIQASQKGHNLYSRSTRPKWGQVRSSHALHIVDKHNFPSYQLPEVFCWCSINKTSLSDHLTLKH